MTTRRDFLSTASLAATGFALAPLAACSQESPPAATTTAAASATAETPFIGPLLKRKIPSTGESIPVIGMGTSGSFEVGRDETARAPLREVLKRFVDAGASVIDTAPTYSSAEDALGDLVAEARLRDRLFLATKLSGVSGIEQGRQQFVESLRRLRTDRIDLLQVHNLRDTRVQFALARELKQQGKVRLVGLTHYRDEAHAELADEMRALKPDFVQINYSVVSRGAERTIFPLARELGIAVMVNRAFEDGRLFAQVKGKPLPTWASEVGADSWAQLFLKFVLSETAVTVVIPATSKPRNQTDNLKAGVGAMLDAKQREALVVAVG
ncbi:aldo/keto reductase [Lysobacter capsici]|uniref:aldo/keto reductase n=1 Tax=Lysobacter capsici TaxID=435897 RepID=UPI000BBB65C8|nr:aldo/keto reductase [Lysobacter capsici]ATE72878.1 aldo/keto reductase [Lysobacter capsici]